MVHFFHPPTLSFSRESFTNLTYEDIPDVSDDDRMDGEDPLLESMAAARRLGLGSDMFPITVTGGNVEGRAVANFGMTLEHYMSQMVTTPASAAATSGM